MQVMRSQAKFAVIAILWFASLPATCRPTAATAIDASLCDVVNHPSRFAGKLVRVRVQDALNWVGNPILVEPLSLTFKVDLAAKPCIAGVDVQGPLPRGWLAPTDMRAFEGPISRFQPPLSYGPVATVIAKVESSLKPQPKPRIVRDSKGKIIETNFWNSAPIIPEPEVRLVIERVVEE